MAGGRVAGCGWAGGGVWCGSVPILLLLHL